MKLNGISPSIQLKQNGHHAEMIELLDPHELGDEHVMTSVETPMREDAFMLTDEDKVEIKRRADRLRQ